VLRRRRKGRFLRQKAPITVDACSCAWPVPLPWRRLQAGAIWECGHCRQQWEWIASGDSHGWRRLPVEAWIDAESTDSGAPPPAAWRSVLYGSERERV
jgi:hypothetical protein